MKLVEGLVLVFVLVPMVVAAVRLVVPRTRVMNGRWMGMLLIGCAASLCVWMVVLGLTLPRQFDARHWRAAWIGLDGMEACCLAATGFLTLKRDSRVGAVAGAAAALLTVDAWFDMTTAEVGANYLIALFFGVAFELPLATICALIAWQAPRRFAPPTTS